MDKVVAGFKVSQFWRNVFTPSWNNGVSMVSLLSEQSHKLVLLKSILVDSAYLEQASSPAQTSSSLSEISHDQGTSLIYAPDLTW